MKLRLNRILQGWKLKFFSRKTDRAKKRHETCLDCPLLKKGVCTVCWCPSDAKSNVIEEYCPKNKWFDTMIMNKTGIALINLSEQDCSIDVRDQAKSFIVDLGKVKNGNKKTVKLKAVNDRAKFEQFEDKMDLTNLSLRPSCPGCIEVSEPPQNLPDGESFDFTITFSPKIKGSINKKVFLKSTQETIKILLKGQVV